jgi:uncharacterized protein YllA (UPF0747 family)
MKLSFLKRKKITEEEFNSTVEELSNKGYTEPAFSSANLFIYSKDSKKRAKLDIDSKKIELQKIEITEDPKSKVKTRKWVVESTSTFESLKPTVDKAKTK